MKVEVVELLKLKLNADIKYAPNSSKAPGTYKGATLLVETTNGPKTINIPQSRLDSAHQAALKAQLETLDEERYDGFVVITSEKAPNGVNVNVVAVEKAPEAKGIGVLENSQSAKTAKPEFLKEEGGNRRIFKPSGFDDPEVIARITRHQALACAVQISDTVEKALVVAEAFMKYIMTGPSKTTVKEVKEEVEF